MMHRNVEKLEKLSKCEYTTVPTLSRSINKKSQPLYIVSYLGWVWYSDISLDFANEAMQDLLLQEIKEEEL